MLADGHGTCCRFSEDSLLESLSLSISFLGALAVAGGQWAMPGAVEGPRWKQAEDIRDIYDFRDVLGT